MPTLESFAALFLESPSDSESLVDITYPAFPMTTQLIVDFYFSIHKI